MVELDFVLRAITAGDSALDRREDRTDTNCFSVRWDRILYRISRGLFKLGISPFVDELYEEWTLQGERCLLWVC